MASLAPLAIAICLDVYLIARVIVGSAEVAGMFAAPLFGVFVVLWWLLPRGMRRRRRDASSLDAPSVHHDRAD